MTEVDADSPPVPARWRVLQRAIYTLIQEGKSPTFAAIGKEIGVSKQAVWQFFSVNRDFLEWLDEEMRTENARLFSSLARRHYHIGMQGSVPSADFFAKSVSGYYLRQGSGGAGDAAPGGGSQQFILNLLVPRPDMPTFPGQATTVVAAALPANVPRVNVR